MCSREHFIFPQFPHLEKLQKSYLWKAGGAHMLNFKLKCLTKNEINVSQLSGCTVQTEIKMFLLQSESEP